MQNRERQLFRRIKRSFARGHRRAKCVVAASAVGALLVPLLPAAPSSAAPSAAFPGTACARLAGVLSALQNVRATAQLVPAAGYFPAHCRVDLDLERAINVRVVLPLNPADGGAGGTYSGAWNGRLMNMGGGGYAGRYEEPYLGLSLLHGEVGSATDTGHSPAWCNAVNPATGQPNSQPDCGQAGGGFVLDPQNNLIADQIADFAYRSLEAQTTWAQKVAKFYYWKNEQRNYWVGTSQGGRQGWEMAQRYGDRYDGYLVGMPGLNMNRFSIGETWPAVVVNQLLGPAGLAPAKSDAANAAAVQACDNIDGTADGVIAEPRRCHFDAAQVPGLTPTEARAINLIWDGPRTQTGGRLWGGITPGTTFSAQLPGGNTMSPLMESYLRNWVYQDPRYDWRSRLTMENFEQAFRLSYTKFRNSIATDSTDLSAARNSGAKIIFWHGTGDETVVPFGSYNYQQRLFDRYGVANTRSFVRTFYFPTVGHTFPVLDGNINGQGVLFDALIDWVENGHAPESVNQNIGTATHLICAYPDVAQSDGTCRTQNQVPTDLTAESRTILG